MGLVKGIIQTARLGTPLIDLYLVSGDNIMRSDECRILLFAGSENMGESRSPLGNPSVQSRLPFGTIQACNVDLEVWQYICCGYSIKYIGWKWELRNGVNTDDKGYHANLAEHDSLTGELMLALCRPTITQKSEIASRVATRSIF